MFDKIYNELAKRYGNLDMENLEIQLKKDGLGGFANILLQNREFFGQIARELSDGLEEDIGVMPTDNVSGIPLTAEDTFPFAPSACLQKCTGECCKHKNYLMITLADIYDMISSRGADFFGIRSTRDLFEGNPPLLELFFSEEYQLYFSYMRYLPVGTEEITTRPEDASDSICPFLRPINAVYDHHKMDLPAETCFGAMGCMFMESKPLICRASPLGMMTGLETGKVSYEYMPPALDCPACASSEKVLVVEYMASINLPGEEEQRRRFHKILMHSRKIPIRPRNKEKFRAVTKDIYNIDGLLARYGHGIEHRPNLETLTKIYFQAVKGDFSGYDELLDVLNSSSKHHTDLVGLQ